VVEAETGTRVNIDAVMLYWRKYGTASFRQLTVPHGMPYEWVG
jgi:hypothetical protein